MNPFPHFFEQAPKIRVIDPLAKFLGVNIDGYLEYQYTDAVKLCGHSCPTVASAYLMVYKALAILYPDTLAQRGNIEAIIQGEENEGVAGVTASVVTLLTGAATGVGFGGIGMQKHFSRRHLLSYSQAIEGEIILKRRDTKLAVSISFNNKIIPLSMQMRELMPKAINGEANLEELNLFGELWQSRVKSILVDKIDDPNLVSIRILS